MLFGAFKSRENCGGEIGKVVLNDKNGVCPFEWNTIWWWYYQSRDFFYQNINVKILSFKKRHLPYKRFRMLRLIFISGWMKFQTFSTLLFVWFCFHALNVPNGTKKKARTCRNEGKSRERAEHVFVGVLFDGSQVPFDCHVKIHIFFYHDFCVTWPIVSQYHTKYRQM